MTTMKVRCVLNQLADALLTPVHRSFFERYFKDRPQWQAPVGSEFVVHGIYIVRGYPFYWLRVPERPGGRHAWRWRLFPNVCFEIVDDRVSSYWRVITRISAPRSGEQYFITRLGTEAWLRTPGFWQNLVEGHEAEYEVMMRAGDLMDIEFAPSD
jgi:hypothetical protein